MQRRWYQRLLIFVVVILLSCSAALWLGARDLLTFPEDRKLAAARQRWATHAIPHYRLVVRMVDDDGGGCRQDIVVQHEQVMRVFENTCRGSARTVTELFDWIEQRIASYRAQPRGCGPNGCACDGTLGVDATYDAERGYPTSTHIHLLPEEGSRFPSYWWKWIWGGGKVMCTAMGGDLQSFYGEELQVIDLQPVSSENCCQPRPTPTVLWAYPISPYPPTAPTPASPSYPALPFP